MVIKVFVNEFCFSSYGVLFIVGSTLSVNLLSWFVYNPVETVLTDSFSIRHNSGNAYFSEGNIIHKTRTDG